MNEIQSKIAQIIKKISPDFEIPIEDIHLQAFITKRIEDLGLDSLETMEFIMEIEDHYGIMLDEDMVLACSEIGDLIALVSTIANAPQ